MVGQGGPEKEPFMVMYMIIVSLTPSINPPPVSTFVGPPPLHTVRLLAACRLYLTEVAVRSDCRRLGIARHLLALVDDVASQLRTSEVGCEFPPRLDVP